MNSHTSEDQPKKDDQHPAKDNPDQHGEIPRTRDDSKDDQQDPFQDS